MKRGFKIDNVEFFFSEKGMDLISRQNNGFVEYGLEFSWGSVVHLLEEITIALIARKDLLANQNQKEENDWSSNTPARPC